MSVKRLVAIASIVIAVAGCGPGGESPAPSLAPTPTVLAEYHKMAEGGHDGPPVLDIPGPVTVDYAVRGTCTFEIDTSTEAGSDAGLPRLSVSVSGPEQRGSWSIELEAGRYVVAPSEAVGCTFDVVVTAPG